MANIASLKMELRQYETLKANLSTFANRESNASSSATEMAKTLTNHYKINDDTNKGSIRTEKLAREMQKEVEYITGTIIPAIDRKMEEIRREIERLEREEAERKASMRTSRTRFSSFRW